MAVYYCIFSFSFLLQSRKDKSNSNTNNLKQIKIKLMFRIIKFKSVKTLNFITWKDIYFSKVSSGYPLFSKRILKFCTLFIKRGA